MAKKEDPELNARYADMLSAMGTEPRLRIVRLFLSAHPEGMVVGEDATGAPTQRPGRRGVGHTIQHFVASPGKIEERGPGACQARRHLPLVLG